MTRAREMKCKCGALVASEPLGDGQFSMWHPQPLCQYVIGLQASGDIQYEGPARLDRETGEIVFDDRGAN